MNTDFYFKLAIEKAEESFQKKEIPVGAVLVTENDIYSSCNMVESARNPLAHAEFIVIREALKKEKYLNNSTLFVTLEPCIFCGSAIFLSRISEVYFGAYNKKDGFSTVFKMDKKNIFNHRIKKVEGGIKQEKCESLLKNFFKELRKQS